METKDFSAVTPEIEALAAKSRENNRIDISLYDKYEVKRGLRDLNGKGVLTGLTEISEVKASEVDENGVSHPCDGKLYYRGHDVEKLMPPVSIPAFSAPDSLSLSSECTSPHVFLSSP